MFDRSILAFLFQGTALIVVGVAFYLLMAALTLWGLFQLITGKGRHPKDTNRGLGILKVSIGISSLGLPVLTVAFGLLWLGLEALLRKQAQ